MKVDPYYSSGDPCSSSSGSAISVAANMVTLALGTETHSSIIFPYDQNSVVGLQPTVALTSRAAVIMMMPSWDTNGHSLYQTGNTPLALVWKDESCSQYVIDTDSNGQVPNQQQVVLELQGDGKLITSDDPPVEFGCLDLDFVQKSRIEELSCKDNIEQVEELIGEGTSCEYLVGRMGTIKKPKETPECSTAATMITDIPEGALEEIKLQLREEVRDEFKQELQGLIEFKDFVMERRHLFTTIDKDDTVPIPSVGSSDGASGGASDIADKE